ncbi:MAG: tetratricopeptide repeat protein [Pseudomonadota bacterium]
MAERRAWKRERFGLLALALAAAALIAAIGLSRGTAPAKLPAAAKAPDDLPATVASLEDRMRAKPDDVEGWRSLGAAYFEGQRYTDAAGAYARATRLKPDRAEIWSALGEAQTLAINAVDPVAHDAFTKALKLDPRDARARYFLAVEKDVSGDHKGAVDDWIAMLRDAPPGAAWAQSVHDLVLKVASQYRIDVKGRVPDVAPAPVGASGDEAARGAIPGPSAGDISDARGLSPSDQDQMARGMVDRLAQRLARQPSDLDGWIRLMRARMVLGDGKAAGAALNDARRAFSNDSAALARLGDAARALKVPGS